MPGVGDWDLVEMDESKPSVVVVEDTKSMDPDNPLEDAAFAVVLQGELTSDDDFPGGASFVTLARHKCKFLEEVQGHEPFVATRADIQSFYVKSKHDSHYYLIKMEDMLATVFEVASVGQVRHQKGD